MKRTVRLSENELKRMIAESVKRVLNEDAYSNINEVKIVFENFGNEISKLIKKYQVDDVADRKIGRLIHALETLVIDSVNGRSFPTTTWGIDRLDI